MGVDLKLLVIHGQVGANANAPTMLEFGRESEVFERLDAVAKPVQFSLYSYVSMTPDGPRRGEDCYGLVVETPYGEPLTFVTAAEFQEIMRGFDTDEINVFAKAAIAYVQALSPDVLIALYYH